MAKIIAQMKWRDNDREDFKIVDVIQSTGFISLTRETNGDDTYYSIRHEGTGLKCIPWNRYNRRFRPIAAIFNEFSKTPGINWKEKHHSFITLPAPKELIEKYVLPDNSKVMHVMFKIIDKHMEVKSNG